VTTISGPGFHLYADNRVGDTWVVNGEEIGRVESMEYNGCTTIEVIPSLLYSAREVAWRGKVERRPRHLTSEIFPGHDGPVAWRVSGTLEWCGLPVVLCPAFLLDGVVRIGQVPDEVTVLDTMPGAR
jgi:hypothetical protein